MMNREKTGNRRKRRDAIKKKITFLLSVAVLVCTCSMLFGGFFASAHEQEEGVLTADGNIYYKSIEIQYGDSLWSIAEEYMTEEGQTIQEAIEILKEINNLESDCLQEGNYLTVAYVRQI